jgi:methionyl-tRNA formyltransferase
MLCNDILGAAPSGAFNLHGSLLPAYRGRAPVNWVLVNGEKRTGITLHHMVEKPDAGDIVGQWAVDIDFSDTARTLYGKLCAAAGTLLAEVLPLIRDGKAPRIPQDLSKGCYFGGRGPEDGRIDWNRPAVQIYNLIRAVTDPYPGAFAFLPGGEKILIWWALPEEDAAPDCPPGRIQIERGQVHVGTGMGRIRLADIEVSGARMKNEGMLRFFGNKEGIILT